MIGNCNVIVIFRTMWPTVRQTYNWYCSRCNKIFNPIPHCHEVHFFTNQEAQPYLLLVLRHVLLHHLFHTPKFPYGSHLYVGAIQIETFCLKSLENGQGGRNTFSGFCDPNETLIFMSKLSIEAFLEINYELVFQRKEGHIFS